MISQNYLLGERRIIYLSFAVPKLGKTAFYSALRFKELHKEMRKFVSRVNLIYGYYDESDRLCLSLTSISIIGLIISGDVWERLKPYR
jgi:hypothetical protein